MMRRYHHWETWECLAMYLPGPQMEKPVALQAYADFLRDLPRFARALRRVIQEWPIACEQFLTNESMNRIAWLGQASMCLETGIPREYRAGFMLLSHDERIQANATADRTLQDWLGKYAG